MKLHYYPSKYKMKAHIEAIPMKESIIYHKYLHSFVVAIIVFPVRSLSDGILVSSPDWISY